MKTIWEYIAISSGYTDGKHLTDSTFHPDITWLGPVAGFFGAIAYVFENVFGIHLMVGVILSILFFLELYTGVKASQEGFDSKKFPKGFIKLGIYMLMIGSTNILSIYVPHNEYAGIDINVYAFIHYTFYNFVLINLILSNIENFMRLGWNFNGLIPHIARVLNLKVYKEHEKEKENAGNNGE